MDEELLSILNPAFKRKHIPDNGEKYKLCIPSEMHDAFVSNKSGFKIEPLENRFLEEEYFFEDKNLDKQIEIRYLVREGDLLDSLSGMFNCPSTDLIAWNKLTGDSLEVGRELIVLIPVRDRLLVSERLESHIKKMEKGSGEYIWHIVSQGETLYEIFRKHKMFDVNRIRKENGLTDKDVITIGMELKVGRSE
jgi:membrane-bound lytic murein transglycosylase D